MCLVPNKESFLSIFSTLFVGKSEKSFNLGVSRLSGKLVKQKLVNILTEF